ncbi:MAG: hypothetical protein ACOC58_05055 [Chloroflexota bacterium]
MTDARGNKSRREEEVAEEIEVKVKRPLEKIVPVRLSAAHWSELREYARELGIGPTTLARMWILERLAFIRKGATGASAPGAVMRGARAPASTQRHASLDQLMEKIAGSLPDDEKLDIFKAAEESMAPVFPHNWQEVEATLMPADTAEELGRKFFRALARSMEVETVEEGPEARTRDG